MSNEAGKANILVRPGITGPLVARIWRGRTRAADADEYLDYLYEAGVLPVEAKPGCLGMQMFRRIDGDVARFTTISYWRAFADMSQMHATGEEILRPHHLERDPHFLLELPQRVEVAELHANDWLLDR